MLVLFDGSNSGGIVITSPEDGSRSSFGIIVFYIGSKNAVFWDIFTAVTINNTVFGHMAWCGSCHPEDGDDMFLRNIGSY
jgi:hypothetical protein